MKKGDNSTSSLAPLLEKIEELSKPQRIAIYAGTLVVIAGLSFYLLLWPKIDKIGQLNRQLGKVQAELATAKKNADELNDWRNKMMKKEAEYKTVMQALPDKEEIPSLLAGISKAGKDAGLDFVLFAPKPEVPRDFYAEIAVDINVTGTYHQVVTFFDKVANLERIVNIRGIKMAPVSGGKDQSSSNLLSTTCQAVTYKFIESGAGASKGKRGTQGKRNR